MAVIGIGHTDQFADECHGQREGEVLDQVGGRPGLRHPVEQLVGDRAGTVAQELDTASGELLAQQGAHPGVVRGVDGDEAPAAGARHRTDPGLVAADGLGEAEAGVGEDAADILMTYGEPGVLAVGETHPGEGLVPQRAVVGVESEALGGPEGVREGFWVLRGVVFLLERHRGFRLSWFGPS